MTRLSLGRRKRRLSGKLLLASITFLVMLEVVLQGAAMIATASMARRNRGVRDTPHVLCIGDSFTYGVGASSSEYAYPGSLAVSLKESGIDIPVINGGWPGRTSSDLVEHFGNQIDTNTKVLCILVGTNDSWRHPDPITEAELQEITSRSEVADEGFTWQFRTAKLVSVLLGFDMGSWLTTGDEVVEGAREAQAARVPEVGEAAKERLVARRTEGLKLLVGLGFKHREPVVLAALEPVRPMMREFWGLMGQSRLEAALDVAVAGLQHFPDSPSLLRARVTALAQLNWSLVEPLSQLEELHESAPTALTLECLMMAARMAGQDERALGLAKERIAQEPASKEAWVTRANAANNLGLWREVAECAPTAIELTAVKDPGRAAWIMKSYARSIAKEQPERAAKVVVAGFLLKTSEARARLSIVKLKKHVHRNMHSEAWDTVQVDDEIVRQYEGLLEEVYDGKVNNAWHAVLVDHVKILGDLAAKSGTKVIVLTYPFYQKEVDALQLKTAAAIGADLAHVRERFAAELKTRDRTDLFVSDGHCNDAGYALMAEIVAPLVVKALEE